MITGFLTIVLGLFVLVILACFLGIDDKSQKHWIRNVAIFIILGSLIVFGLMWLYLEHWEALSGFYFLAFIIISFIGVMAGTIGGRK